MEAGRSVDGVPEESESWGEERKGGSGLLPWEPAASPSPKPNVGQWRQYLICLDAFILNTTTVFLTTAL